MNISGLMKVTLLDFPEHVACTVFTGGCNFRCPFCYNSELVLTEAAPFMTEEEFFDFLSRRRGRLDGVALSGGEPTLQKDLTEFMRKIKRDFGLSLKLDTNGTHPEVLSEILSEGLSDYVAMDIKSGPSGYGLASGVDISTHLMEAITASKDMLIGGNVDYEFRTTVVGGLHRKADFYEIADFLEGAGKYFLQCFTADGNVLCPENDFYSPAKEELLDFLEIVRPHVGSASLRGID